MCVFVFFVVGPHGCNRTLFKCMIQAILRVKSVGKDGNNQYSSSFSMRSSADCCCYICRCFQLVHTRHYRGANIVRAHYLSTHIVWPYESRQNDVETRHDADKYSKGLSIVAVE